MDDLATHVLDVLNGQQPLPSLQQAKTIDAASKLFDDLQARGLIERPTFRLAPLDSVPPKSFASGPAR